MELLNVSSPEFRPYGRVISGYDVSGLMKAMESTPLPEGVVYVASVPGLEALPIGRELYATTLHYAPCQTADSGFRCVVVLPRGTNIDLDHKPQVRCGEEKLITARNKWLIGHEEGGLDEGAWIGLKGENISL